MTEIKINVLVKSLTTFIEPVEMGVQAHLLDIDKD